MESDTVIIGRNRVNNRTLLSEGSWGMFIAGQGISIAVVSSSVGQGYAPINSKHSLQLASLPITRVTSHSASWDNILAWEADIESRSRLHDTVTSRDKEFPLPFCLNRPLQNKSSSRKNSLIFSNLLLSQVSS